ncbi:U5 small nuclear ribonucleoprotein 40 kDa protein [Lachnellula willkommii]|uniref:U5 small nuclear ribonucleoprotein 40 kDa protein n=1 Tax=Lachnellula willkommii TaxID=215461 RepID=A0A559MCL7_9HELO|nr:U5 small nuclear ribonucleoprotein 40 kDa protein [Lachnellula willkommii]
MSSEKRPGSDDFNGSQMVVKRQNVGRDSKAVALSNGSAGNGALIQSVWYILLEKESCVLSFVRRLWTDFVGIGTKNEWATGASYGAKWTFWRVLWRTFGGCENYGVLQGHKGAVLDLHWSRDSRVLFSASADMHLASWDLETGTRIRRHVGHEEVINTMDISKRGEELLISGSDDGYIGIWDPRTKAAVDFIETEFPVTAVALAEAGNELYSGGIDNDIKVWDMRRKAVVYSMLGHTDTISSLRISPDSQSLLSNSMDSTVRTWDIRPFAPTERHIRTFDGAPAGMEKNLIKASWDFDGKKIAAGSGDGTAVVWDVNSGKLLYKLPGHKGTVNCAELSPSSDPIILSGSSDRNLLLGELK